MVSSTVEVSSPREDIGLRFDAIDLDANAAGFIGFEMAPLIEAPRKRGRFTKRDIGQILISEDTRRTAKGAFNRITRSFGEGRYEVEHRGLEGEVFVEEEAEWEEMISAEDVVIEATRYGVIEGHERDVAKMVTDRAVDLPVLDADWWNLEDSLVTDAFAIWKEKFKRQCGRSPNTLQCDTAVVDQLMQNASVLEKAGKTGSSVRELLELHDAARELRLQALAIALGLSKIVESRSVKNTAEQGPGAVPVLETIFPQDRAVLFARDDRPTTMVQQWLRTIHWSAAGSRPGTAFDEYDEPQTLSRVLRHRMDYVVQEINAEAAMIIGNVIDTTIFD